MPSRINDRGHLFALCKNKGGLDEEHFIEQKRNKLMDEVER